MQPKYPSTIKRLKTKTLEGDRVSATAEEANKKNLQLKAVVLILKVLKKMERRNIEKKKRRKKKRKKRRKKKGEKKPRKE